MRLGALTMIEKLIAKLSCYDGITDVETRALASVFKAPVTHLRGDLLARAGQQLEASTLLLSGFVHRYKDLSDGRRQSLELSVPGDFVDLHSFTLKRIDHDIACLSNCRITTAPHSRLREVTAEFPHLARLLWLHTTVDAALHRERIMSLGARTAVERLAHLVCETAQRLAAVGLATHSGFDFPLIQSDLAEFLGLSIVHTNRTIRELRERGLAEIAQRQVRIEDWDGLAKLAQFDAMYLEQSQERR